MVQKKEKTMSRVNVCEDILVESLRAWTIQQVNTTIQQGGGQSV